MLDKEVGPANQSRRCTESILYLPSHKWEGLVIKKEFHGICSARAKQARFRDVIYWASPDSPLPAPVALHFDAHMQCVWGAGVVQKHVEQWTRALEHSALLPDVFLFSCPPPPPHFLNIHFDQEVWYRWIVSINPLKEAGSLAECSLIKSSNMFKRCSQV